MTRDDVATVARAVDAGVLELDDVGRYRLTHYAEVAFERPEAEGLTRREALALVVRLEP
jgi:hypothetical protein